jgi:hypothetical protein
MIATNETQFHGADEAIELCDEAIHLRGAVDVHGDVVPRGFPTLISVQNVSAISLDASGRRELTNWLLSDENPLVARVIVNRVWQHVFGQGIVRTTDNFGFTGDPPSHPDLLDYLARRFRDKHAWSFKSLIRELVISHTWRQASDHRHRNPPGKRGDDTDSDMPRLLSESRSAVEIDPTNHLLWRGNIRRNDAEALVDSLRFVAGTLDPEPATRTVPEFDVGNQGSTSDLKIDKDILRKRALYWPVFRKDVPVVMDVLEIFDFPTSTAPRGTRDVTHVPAQSLSLLNSPMILDAARSLARDVRQLNTDDAGKLDHLYIRMFARGPTQAEHNRAAKFLDSFSIELTRAKAAKPVDSRDVA